MQLRQPLTELERHQILSRTGHSGGLVGIVAVIAFIVVGIAVVVGAGVDWVLLGIVAAIVAGGAAVIWAIITSVERGLKREVETGEKVVTDGHVACLSTQELNGVNFYCLRFQVGNSGEAPLDVTVPEHVYRQLYENEAVQLTYLPISKLILGVNTKGFRWRLGDVASRRPL